MRTRTNNGRTLATLGLDIAFGVYVVMTFLAE